MPDLPTGTVIFLFTDIEGSTQRWEKYHAAMARALARHDALLREAVQARGGHVFKTIGDAFQVAFGDPYDAILATVDAQRALAAEDWSACGDGFPALRVRMALHVGAAAPEDDGDYRTPLLNRVARLMSAGHGGQVLLSTALWELVRDTLPDGVSLRDLGERRLKDLRRPERVFQMLAPDLLSDFPPLATLDARPNNLPVQLTAFVGRETVLMELTHLLQTSHGPRLITLTGPGGTGKTRLALQTAAALIDDFAHGVWFVDLASLVDSELIPATIAAALDLKPIPGEPILDTLKAWLAGRQLLLVLDNFEQLLDGAPVVTDLLACAPRLKVLATSRAALRLRGERDFPVDPLSAPSVNTKEPVEAIAQYPAVELFVQRAVDVAYGFALTPANATAVGRICGRLEGLPLAIELAAARVSQFDPESLLERLESHLKVLTDGYRDLPTRQQTMRAAIDWSYDLLAAAERVLFARLSVFRGGWTLEGAQAVCAGEGIEEVDVPDLLGRLAGWSLGVAGEREGAPWYGYLETVREYAGEKLVAAGDAEAIRDRHLVWYLSLAQAAEPHLSATDAPAWIARLEREADNMRGALDWSLHSTEPGLSEQGVRLLLVVQGWLGDYGGPHEVAKWSDLALAAPTTQQQPDLLARCTYTCANFHAMIHDTVLARVLYEQAIRMFTELDMERELAWALQDLGQLFYKEMGDFDKARSLIEDSIALRRRVAPAWDLAIGIIHLGELTRMQGDLTAAMAAYEEAVALTESGEGNADSKLSPLHNLGLVSLRVGNPAKARQYLERALAIGREFRHRGGIASCLAGLAGVAAAVGNAARAARLFGAADVLLEVSGILGLAPVDQSDRDDNEAIARTLISPGEWDTACADGRVMSEEDAVAYALGEIDPWGEAIDAGHPALHVRDDDA